MAIIVRNDYGAIAVNKGVLERMIVEDMITMSSEVLLCNRNGKPIKEKPTPFIDPDYFDAVEVTEKKGESKVKIFIIVKFGGNISNIAETIFAMVENDYAMLHLPKPGTISVKVRGIISAQGEDITRRNIDVVRKNA